MNPWFTAGFALYSQVWAPSDMSADSLCDFRVESSDLCSSSPDLSLEKLSNSLGDELHVRFIKPNVKYIELDAVVGTVQGSTHQSRSISWPIGLSSGVLNPEIVITEEIPEIYQALISNNFQQGDFECEICFDDKEGFLCHRMSNCGHVFCQVQGFMDDLLQIFRSSSGKPWLGMSFWLLFIPNSRWRHKSYLSKRGLRRTNITAGYWVACKWSRFHEIRSTSVSKDGYLRPKLGPTRLLLRSVEPL